jgi:hypothetical protein
VTEAQTAPLVHTQPCPPTLRKSLTSNDATQPNELAKIRIRDEEAVGSNPATPTPKQQVKAVCDRCAIASGDQLRDYGILFRWCIPAVEAISVGDGDRAPVVASGTETKPKTVIPSLPTDEFSKPAAQSAAH